MVEAYQYTKALGPNDLGEKTYDKTSNLRCPDLDFAVEEILEVASCFEETDQKEKAMDQLVLLSDPKTLGGCIDGSHLKIIERRIEKLNVSL